MAKARITDASPVSTAEPPAAGKPLDFDREAPAAAVLDSKPPTVASGPTVICPRCHVSAIRTPGSPSWLVCPNDCGFRVQDHTPMLQQLQRQRLQAAKVGRQDRSAR